MAIELLNFDSIHRAEVHLSGTVDLTKPHARQFYDCYVTVAPDADIKLDKERAGNWSGIHFMNCNLVCSPEQARALIPHSAQCYFVDPNASADAPATPGICQAMKLEPTQEQLEAVAMAIVDYTSGLPRPNAPMDSAKAAWATIAPIVRDMALEEAAQVAENDVALLAYEPDVMYDRTDLARGLCAMATRIRALKGKP
jgi:hypothetical protein